MLKDSEIPFADAVWATPVGDDSFEAVYPTWWEGDRVFGGLVLAQAVAACCQTVPSEIPIHSLHGYFLRPASPGAESRINVERVRDGRSFRTRRSQTEVSGKVTFEMLASFHVPEEGEEYRMAPAQVPGPDKAVAISTDPFSDVDPFELIELGPSEQSDDGTFESTRRAWVRCAEPLPGDPRAHAAVAAYASDMTRAAFRPRSLGSWGEHVDASLDHSIWFHRPADMSEWHLFDLHVVTTGAGRSMMRGSMHSVDGALVLTMAQEILIRRLDGGIPISFEDPTQLPGSP